MEGTVIVEAEAAHGDDHAEEMEEMGEMGHGDDHAGKGMKIYLTSLQPVTSGEIHHIGANSDDDTLLVHLFGADDDGELKITLNSKIITPFDDGSYFVLVDNEEVLTLNKWEEPQNTDAGAVNSWTMPEFGTCYDYTW